MSTASKGRVLLIESGQGHTTQHEAALAAAGYQVWRVAPAQASNTAATTSPDIIVIEFSASPTTAAHTASVLRTDPTLVETPILALNTAPTQSAFEAALESGADDCLSAGSPPSDILLRAGVLLRLGAVRRMALEATQSLQNEATAMSRLRRFYEEVLTDESIERTCRRTVETAGELMGSERVSLLLLDPQRQTLRFAWAIGIDEHVWRDQEVPLSSPIAGRVYATQRELVVNRASKALWTVGQYETPWFVSVPMVCTPLRARGGAVGVLNVTERRQGQDYRPEEVQILRQLAQTAAFALDAIRTRRKLDETRDSIIFSMAKLSEYRHNSTGQHLERVQALSILLAKHLARDPRIDQAIDEQFITDLGRAAPLHDVGKVAIPDRILLKEGKLTPEEFRLIQDHTRIGAQTLRSVIARGHDATFLKMAMDIAHYHHERYDGGGYPAGLAGTAIPLAARIVCVADSYDAIRTRREYKPARSHEEAARELLKAAHTQFDPHIVQAFCALEEEFRRTYDQMAENGDEAHAQVTAETLV